MMQMTLDDPAELNERYTQFVFPIMDKFGAPRLLRPSGRA